MRIYESLPTDWKDLEVKVAQVFNQAGFHAQIEKQIETVRGSVNIDVFAENKNSTPQSVYLVECKYWTSDIPQTVIHSFRTVVNDFGANFGLIVAKNNFQSGALEAIKNTNIKLISWSVFLDLFERRWLESMIISLDSVSSPLREYTDPLDVIGFDRLDEEGRKLYTELCVSYVGVGIYSSKFLYQHDYKSHIFLKEDIDNVIRKVINEVPFSPEINCYMDYFQFLRTKSEEGISKFKELFERYIKEGGTSHNSAFTHRGLASPRSPEAFRRSIFRGHIRTT